MGDLLKNQRNLFVAIFSGMILMVSIWYYGFHQSLASAYTDMKKSQKSLVSKRNQYRRMESEIINIQDEWDILNDEFETVIRRIPDKLSFDNVSNALYNMMKNNGLSIKNYSPSNIAIDKKTILIPESGDEIIIEKIPFDIEVKGTFVNFGKFLETMSESRYRLTASNIDIVQKGNSPAQIIKFISYAYFQTAVYHKPVVNVTKPKPIKKSTSKKLAKASSKKIDRPKDAPDDVPDWMFEPATEPIVESGSTQKSETKTQKKTNKKNLPQKSDTKNNNQIKSKELSPERVGKITETILTQLKHSAYILDDLKFMIDDYDPNYADVIQLLLENNTIAYNDKNELFIVEVE